LRDDDRVSLPYDDTGSDGRAVVLLHAGIADRSMWTELLPELAAAGYRGIALDLPEFGEAELVPDSAPYREVLKSMDALGVADAVLVGNSFGGAVALRVAAAAPERLSGLVLVSTPPVPLMPSPELQRAWNEEAAALERGDVEAAVSAVVDAWTLPDAPDQLRDRVARMQRRAFEHQLGVEETEFPDPLDADPHALRRVAAPVLIAAGQSDLPDFRHGARRLAELFERTEVVMIRNAGHLAPLEQPEAFRDLLLEYLQAHVAIERPPTSA
jgi:pimeloyl-ACP methyl ester carboxylesterase